MKPLPKSQESSFTATLAEADELARRAHLIERADYCCQKCRKLAWNNVLMRDLQLRPKEPVAGHPAGDDWIFCGKCALDHDRKKAKHHRKAS